MAIGEREAARKVMVKTGQIVKAIAVGLVGPAGHARPEIAHIYAVLAHVQKNENFGLARIGQFGLFAVDNVIAENWAPIPSVPPPPPRKMFMDIERTRGLASPLTVTNEWSEGHCQIRSALPQYGHIGLRVILLSGSQFAGLPGLKSSVPVTQAAAAVSGGYGSSLGKRG